MTISSFEFIKRATANFKQSHYAQKQVGQTKKPDDCYLWILRFEMYWKFFTALKLFSARD